MRRLRVRALAALVGSGESAGLSVAGRLVPAVKALAAVVALVAIPIVVPVASAWVFVKVDAGELGSSGARALGVLIGLPVGLFLMVRFARRLSHQLVAPEAHQGSSRTDQDAAEAEEGMLPPAGTKASFRSRLSSDRTRRRAAGSAALLALAFAIASLAAAPRVCDANVALIETLEVSLAVVTAVFVAAAIALIPGSRWRLVAAGAVFALTLLALPVLDLIVAVSQIDNPRCP
jgi:hypothetical protein